MKAYFLMIAIFSGAALLMYKAISESIPKEIENKNYAVGEIVDFATGKRGGSIFSFEVEGKFYNSESGKVVGRLNKIGEKYIIEYDSLNPATSKVLGYYPVFLQNEITEKIKGEVTGVSLFGQRGVKEIRYKYLAKGKTYKRSQLIEKERIELVGEIREGFQLDIEYSVRQPFRSLIRHEILSSEYPFQVTPSIKR